MKSGRAKDCELPVMALLGVPTLHKAVKSMLEAHEAQTQALLWLKFGSSSVIANTNLAAQGNQRRRQSS